MRLAMSRQVANQDDGTYLFQLGLRLHVSSKERDLLQRCGLLTRELMTIRVPVERLIDEAFHEKGGDIRTIRSIERSVANELKEIESDLLDALLFGTQSEVETIDFRIFPTGQDDGNP